MPSAIPLSNFICLLRSFQDAAMATSSPQESKPFTFLALAPNTSSSYPREQRKSIPLPLGTDSTTEPAKEDDSATKSRASSLSSENDQNTSGRRFLKLGPVHWGEHQDDHKGDWHEVAVE